MEKSKADKMMEQVQAMRADIDAHKKDVDRRINAQHKLINSEVIVLKDYDVKINTLLDLCIEAGVFDKAKFDMLTDVRRGIRLMASDEKIAVGDIVWVNYKAKIEKEDGTLEEIAAQEGLPVRTGTNAMIFEKELIGKSVGDKFNFITAPQDDGPDKGKSVVMEIEIVKAKTRLIEVHDESGTEPGTGITGGAGDQGQSEPQAPANGSGHEQRSSGVDQPVLQ